MDGKLYLIVARGHDTGARLSVGDQDRIVGRARDADLVLLDPRVSRRHLRIRNAGDEAHVAIFDGATPFMLDGAPRTQANMRIGDTVIIGESALLLAQADEAPRGAAGPRITAATTDVSAMLTGLTADVRGLAGVFALIEALDAAADSSMLKQSVVEWAKLHAESPEVAFYLGDDAERAPVPQGLGHEMVVQSAPDGAASVVVPAHTSAPGWIAFRYIDSDASVHASLRRLLVVAGRICASRIAQLSAMDTLQEDRACLRQQAVGSSRTFLGTSASAERLVRMIPRLAASDVMVLLTGETGVGKTFVARLLHELGPRKHEPLRVINCAAIPESLVESELFGHERGAFTGAVHARAGALEEAGRGTVLLDEIGELPLASQGKLLRVLEEKRFERVGSSQPRKLHARIVVATNRDLEAMVAAGTFRSDLFFRISVVSACVPPLRERGDDLMVLARHILADVARFAGRRIEGFSAAALEVIRRYPWPGNVRELRNAIEHAVVLGDGPRIEPSDFPISLAPALPPIDPVPPIEPAPALPDPAVVATAVEPRAQDDPMVVHLPASLEEIEQRAIAAALRATRGNRTKAAALLGINRQTLYNKLREELPRR